MNHDVTPKPLIWIASSLDDLREFPPEVRSFMGYALYVAQCGLKHDRAKPLRGYGGAGVLEVVRHFDGDTYRAVYTVRLAGRVYALHAFQKKSKRGTATPQADLKLIGARLKRAEELHAEWLEQRMKAQ
jgi:phage-related protein